MEEARKDIINQLRQHIMLMEGHKPQSGEVKEVVGLGPIEAAFPGGTFPTGAIHEFVNLETEHVAASGGFIAGLAGALMKQGGVCLWISAGRRLFPAALRTFGVAPERVIFVDLNREKEVLWATEEALKCDHIVAVIAEVWELTFMQSRRLQLAVEASKVTGFILRNDQRKLNTTACMARWQVRPIPSVVEEGMPGVGFPRWQVDLLKVRNGKPGSWQVEWAADKFVMVAAEKMIIEIPEQVRKVG